MESGIKGRVEVKGVISLWSCLHDRRRGGIRFVEGSFKSVSVVLIEMFNIIGRDDVAVARSHGLDAQDLCKDCK